MMIYKLTAKQIHDQFLSGALGAEEITRHFLKRIEKSNPELNAFLAVFSSRAIEKAKGLDSRKSKKEKLGALAGIPIAIKDNIQILDEMTTCASKILANYRAPYTATLVRNLEEQDAIILGKTNMDEFAMGSSGTHSAFGPTKNPWNHECTPGGSSSGSAAAVSARLSSMAFGSDTGGSIRLPAAFTGIAGFKPTYGRVSRFGLVAFGSSLDQIGPMTINAEDAALVMEVIGQPCNRDSTSIPTPPPRYTAEIEKPISGQKIGVPWKFLDGLQPSTRQNFEKAVQVYKDLGAEIVDIDLSILKYGIAIYYILAAAEASTNLARFDGIRYGLRSKNAKTLEDIYDFSREEGFGSEVKNRILLGTYVLSASQKHAIYEKAQKVRTLLIQHFREAFTKCTVIAMPVSPTPAFALNSVSDPLEEYLQDLYTVGANLGGVPAISIPCGLSHDGKPFGLQLMGALTHDDDVLRFAHAFQKATSFIQVPPAYAGDL